MNEDYLDYDAGDFDEVIDDEDELSCDNCGPWCDSWGGDGLCMREIEAQTKMRKEYEKNHIRKAKCPICGKELTEYDVYAGSKPEPWTWNAGWYYPILAIEVMGALWLKKDVIHGKDQVFHVWIEWGTGKEERLLRYLTEKEARP